MTIATEKLEPVSQRHTLVRIRPGRSIATYMTATGTPNVYEMTWPFSSPPVEISSQGVANYYMQVDTLSLGAPEFTYNEETRLLQLFDTTVNFPTSGIISVAYYYLFFCSKSRGDFDYYEDPDDTNSTRRNWEGRLLTDPAVGASFTDIINGVFSIADTSVSLANADGHFEQFLGDQDSFHRKEFKAWLFINDEKQRVFSGNIASLSINDESLSLNVYDQFSRLKAPAFMGDSPLQCRHSSDATPKDVGKPIPLILGRYSWSKFKTLSMTGLGATASAASLVGFLDEGLKAVCSDFSGFLTTTQNRDWTLCRSLGNVKTQTFGSITRTANPVAGIQYVKFSSYTNVRVGDTISWTEAGTDYSGLIFGVGTFTVAAMTYDIGFINLDTFTTASTMRPMKTVNLRITGSQGADANGSNIFPLQDLDYSVVESNTDGGGKTLKIEWVNNFEARLNSLFSFETVLDPSVHIVHFDMENDGTYGHAAMAKRLLDKAGVDTLAASFTAAEAALVESTSFSIPNIDEQDYAEYKKYLGDLLSSTLGYVWLNNDDEAEYDLLALPSAGDSKDENITLGKGASATVEYQDIVSSLTPDNPHLPIFREKTLSTSSSDKAKYLHEIDNAQTFRHVMAGVSNTRRPQIVALKSQRQVTYSFETATDDIDTVLGQDLTLDTPRLLGLGNVKVTAIEKSADRVRLTATDLLGL